MRLFLGTLLVAAFAVSPVRADEGANTVLDKAIKALGGEEKLAKAKIMTWKVKGKITFNENTNEFTGQTTVRGLDGYRNEFDGEFNGNAAHGITVLSGDKAWRKFGDNLMELEGEMLANEKRSVYLQAVPTVLVPLKGKDFKIESAGEQTIDGKPATAIKATGPDGKDFTIYFDKETSLPIKVAARITGFQGQEIDQETSLKDYKEFDGIKKATTIETKWNGNRFVEVEVTEFKVPDKVDDDTFSEPK